jgi:hypothetical protein
LHQITKAERTTKALLKSVADEIKLSSCNSNQPYISADFALSGFYFLFSSFVFLFGRRYQLTKRYYHAFSNAGTLYANCSVFGINNSNQLL